jgi:hypothetical protein
MEQVFSLSQEFIDELMAVDAVEIARERIDAKESGAEYFSIPLTPTIRAHLQDSLGLQLTGSSVPLRWIKGDTKAHVDTGARSFEKTHLAYLTDSPGDLVVDGQMYPITRGGGYVFSEGVQHETVGTGDEPRLLLGPMSEAGFSVGGPTTVYIRQAEGSQEYSYDNQETWSTVTWPFNIGYGGSVEFVTDISLNSIDNYFICSGDFIKIGSTSLPRPVITIDGVIGYPGLIQNGTFDISGQSNIYVYNLMVATANGGTLNTNGGWIGQQYFGMGATENYIVNCASSGLVSEDGGGIIGANAANYSGSLTIIGCSNSGAIGEDGGGIVGRNAGDEGGTLVITSCWNTGDFMEVDIGGIVGSGAEGTISISNCYNTGSTYYSDCGGIVGANTSGTMTITNCYNTGNLTGARCGGILGDNATNVTITNCYSTGDWNTGGGGICGPPEGDVIISNCYTSGSAGASTGYIFGGSTDVPATCYSEAANSGSGWSSINANSVLTGIPSDFAVGDTWVSTVSDQPYELKLMGYTPYSVINISSFPTELIRTASATVAAGDSTDAAIVSDRGYQILDVVGGNPGFSINATTGSVTASPSIATGVYLLYVRNTGSYNITGYEVTVTEGAITCCAPVQLRGLDYTTRNQVIAGDILVQEVRRYPVSYADLMRMKKANASR